MHRLLFWQGKVSCLEFLPVTMKPHMLPRELMQIEIGHPLVLTNTKHCWRMLGMLTSSAIHREQNSSTIPDSITPNSITILPIKIQFAEIQVGGNFRQYSLFSDGTIFNEDPDDGTNFRKNQCQRIWSLYSNFENTCRSFKTYGLYPVR